MMEEKNSDQDFTLSPELEERLTRVFNELREKDPDDERLESKSSFVNFILTQVGILIECGYGLDDIEALLRAFGGIEKAKRRIDLE